MLDVRTAQNQLEDLLRDTILFALGKRVAAVASVVALRARQTRLETGSALGDDALACIVVSGIVTASYRFSMTSTATDDGAAVLKPDDVLTQQPGRWLVWESDIRLAPVVGGNSYALSELQSGVLERVVVLDKAMDPDEVSGFIKGQVPAVLIEATDDVPEDMTQVTGHRYDTKYTFTVSVIDQNLRDRRQAAQGSAVDPAGPGAAGANPIDGLIRALLGGTNLSVEQSGIRNIQVGRALNWFSTDAQRRVIRSRVYTLQVTEEYPPAPNDTGIAELVTEQAEMTDLGEHDDYDDDNLVSLGITVGLGPGLTKTIAAGTAKIAGTLVTYTGDLKTFTASKDTYRDLLPNGTLAFIETYPDGPEPPETATAMRVGRTQTDGSGVLSDVMLARTRVPYGPVNQTPLD
jgi:hypothetical protein